MENNSTGFLSKLWDVAKVELKEKFVASNIFVLEKKEKNKGIMAIFKKLENVTEEMRKKKILKDKIRVSDIKSKTIA